MGCAQHQHNEPRGNADTTKENSFIAERTTRTATINIDGDIETVFPLFGPELEKEWAPDWSYSPLFIDSKTPQEYSIFTKTSHGHNESMSVWVISKLDRMNSVIEYTLFTSLRVGIINIACKKMEADKTQATITYCFTGLTREGNGLSKHIVEKTFTNNLKDWEEAINTYLLKVK
jgi:hypothetical protein